MCISTTLSERIFQTSVHLIDRNQNALCASVMNIAYICLVQQQSLHHLPVPITTCLHQCCLQLATYKWLHHWNASTWNTFRDTRQRRELWNKVFQPGNPVVHVLQSQTWHRYYTKQKGISCPVTNHVVTVEGEQPTLDHMLVIISWRDKCLHTPAAQYLVNVHSSQATCQYILDLIMRPLLCTFTVKLKFSRTMPIRKPPYSIWFKPNRNCKMAWYKG
jgi:hypothetical protein